MTKMRVHELAKELGVENKEIIELLRSENIEVKSHVSSVDEAGIALVKSKLGAKAESKGEPKAEPKVESKAEPKVESKTEVPEADAAQAEPPKKKNIVQVFRPQN